MAMLKEIEQAVKDCEEYGASDFLSPGYFFWMFETLNKIKKSLESQNSSEDILKIINE